VFDLQKAYRESHYPEVRRPAREVWLEPTLEDIRFYYESRILTSSLIAFDIETAADQITCIGFAPDHTSALVIPFFDPRRGGNYWPTHHDELAAWNLVRTILGVRIPKVTQNGIYDVSYLWRRYGITVADWHHDTMLLHHALYPEAQKGLGYLGSIYTNEPAWKTMRKVETLKRGDE
jgi:hypothetical protein